MQKFSKKNFFLLAFAITFFSSVVGVHAATISFVPSGSVFGIGQEFTVDLKVDSQNTNINAAQGAVQFPISVLQLESVSRTGSVFDFWVQDPTIDAVVGQMNFIAGTPSGVSGGALQILTMKFKAVGAGTANLTFANGTVTASDGKGTNVLGTVQNLTIGVGTNIVAATTLPANIETPQPVVRKPVSAIGLPAAPKLRVPLYPQEDAWYGLVGDAMVLWDVPSDIVQVETRVSHTKDTAAGTVEKQLLTGKDIGTLAEGEWYVRVRFRNNIGWSSSTYYHISIDITPPLPFKVAIDSATSINPSPEINFTTNDALSGIKEYEVIIDGVSAVYTASTTLMIPAQRLGKHTLVVQAYDKAGNAVESNLDFKVLALPDPQLVFVTPSAAQGEPIFISGTALPQGIINVNILDDKKQSVFNGKTEVNNAGDWSMVISHGVSAGRYTASVTVSGAHGEMSAVAESSPIIIGESIIFSIGILRFGWLELFLIALIVIAIVAGIGTWFFVRREERRQVFRIIAIRDIENLGDMLTSQLEEVQKRFKSIKEELPSPHIAELGNFLERAQITAGKIKKYLVKEIEKME